MQAQVGTRAVGFSVHAGMLGLALAYALPLVGSLSGLLGAFTETEKEMVAVERLAEFMSLPQEEAEVAAAAGEARLPAGKGEARVPAAAHDTALATLSATKASAVAGAPSDARAADDAPLLELRGVTATYRPGLPPALIDVSLRVPAGWKVCGAGDARAGDAVLTTAALPLLHCTAGRVWAHWVRQVVPVSGLGAPAAI